jgi:D-sedoheptulose 7-phosphate isomerase
VWKRWQRGGRAASGRRAGRTVRATRQGLPAFSLTTDSSVLTAIANDFDFSQVFARQIQALAAPHYVMVAITTSGNSRSVVEAAFAARRVGVYKIGLLGGDGGAIRTHIDLPIVVPSQSTQRIQEAHIAIIHIVCGIVDEHFSQTPLE